MDQRLLSLQPPFILTCQAPAAIDAISNGGGYVQIHIDFCGISAQTDPMNQLMETISKALGFPEYFGKNWNAFEDCMRDMELDSDSRYAVIIHGFDEVSALDPGTAYALVEHFMMMSLFWAIESNQKDTRYMGHDPVAIKTIILTEADVAPADSSAFNWLFIDRL